MFFIAKNYLFLCRVLRVLKPYRLLIAYLKTQQFCIAHKLTTDDTDLTD